MYWGMEIHIWYFDDLLIYPDVPTVTVERLMHFDNVSMVAYPLFMTIWWQKINS